VDGITNNIDRRILPLTDDKRPLLEPISFNFFEEQFHSYKQLSENLAQQPYISDYAAFISMNHLSPISTLFIDANQRILYINDAGLHQANMSREEVLGQKLEKVLPVHLNETDFQQIWNEGTATNGWNGTIDYQHTSGESRTQWLKFVHFKAPNGKLAYYGIYFIDNVSIRNTDEVTNHLPYLDSVTHLPNFNQFAYDIHQIEQTSLPQECAVALFRCSNLAEIAVLYSKEVRRVVVFEMVNRIQAMLPENYKLYRLSREIFGVFTNPLADMNSFQQLLETIRNKLLEPVITTEQTVFMNIEIGVSSFPEETTNLCTLLEDAEIGLSQHENSKIVYYSKKMTQDFVMSLKTVARLTPAIAKDELEMYYQPLFNHDNEITGAEALLRWHDSELGYIPPNTLIKHAEKHGHISELTYWIFERVFKDKIYETLPNISINIDVTQIEQPNFFQMIQNLVNKHNVDAQSIIFEITEHQAVENSEIGLKVMNQLKTLGFRIALDDFGVGHSALALLGTLPVDIVKVDASFITNQTIETTKGIIAKHIVALSKNLQLKTCCEGIETENEAKLAKTINSDYMQGYLFSYPLTVTKFKQFIKDYIISDE